MSSLLELAAEFFDRMTNPAYGAEVNEEYALRLASLLDEETSGASVPEFPHPWLRTVLVRATRPPSDQQQDRDPHVPIGPGSVRHSRHVHSLLIALLLVERDITLDAATALLHERWEGQQELLEVFDGRMAALDPETRELWQERLRPPRERF